MNADIIMTVFLMLAGSYLVFYGLGWFDDGELRTIKRRR